MSRVGQKMTCQVCKNQVHNRRTYPKKETVQTNENNTEIDVDGTSRPAEDISGTVNLVNLLHHPMSHSFQVKSHIHAPLGQTQETKQY